MADDQLDTLSLGSDHPIFAAFSDAGSALVLLLPIMTVSIGILFVLVLIVHPATASLLGIAKHSAQRSTVMFGMLILHGAMFGSIGALVGFLFSISNLGSFESYIPHFIVVITVLFQLLGRLKRDWSPPLKSLPTMIGGTTAAFVFLFTIIYLHEIGFREKFTGVPSQTEAGTLN